MLEPGAVSPTVLANGQATIGTGEVVLRAANTTRRSLIVRALSTNSGKVYLGAAGVTTGTGVELGPGDALILNSAPTAAMSAIADGAGQDVRFMEERLAS